MIQRMIAFFLLVSPGILIAQNAPIIEDTIAGITVGKSNLGELKHRFGSQLKHDQLTCSVKLNGQCAIHFYIDDEGPIGNQSIIVNIALYNLAHGNSSGTYCENIMTGHGVKLSDSLQRVFDIYGKPSGHLRIGEYEAYGYDNVSNMRSLCNSSPSPGKVVKIRNFGLDWSRKFKLIHSIHAGITNTDCGELDDK
jgi:hypothetical protein